MPELPEVETTRRGLAQVLQGALIHEAQLGKPLRWPLGIEVARLRGQRIAGVRRRGKYVLLDLVDGAGAGPRGVLLLHLGMSGSLRWGETSGESGLALHEHFLMATSAGVLRLHDPRRFGAVVHVPGEDDPRACKLLGSLGPEPWDGSGQPFDAGLFHQALRRRSAAVKQVLLQGQAVVGVGNIYASEALFLAGIHPALPANKISKPRALKLRDAVVRVLGRAIELGGSTLRDFHASDGQAGGYQDEAWVYGRDGQFCRVCGTLLRRMVQGQRSTWLCPQCQTR
jgi:formamidopyrimidine-DNA glycosylase